MDAFGGVAKFTFIVQFKSSLNPIVRKVLTILPEIVKNSMNESLQKVDDCLKLWSRLTKSLMMSGRSYRRRNSWGVVLYSWLLQAKPQLLGWLSLFSVSGDESPCQHLGLAGCELLLEITCSISLGLNRMVPS